MRLKRLAFIFLAFYFIFIGGSVYYQIIFPVRVFQHAFVTILLAGWLIGRIRSGKGLPSTPLNAPLYAAVVVWFVSAVTSIDPRMALENLWFPITHLIIFFVLVNLFQRGRQKLVMETLFLLGAVVVFISAIELASWYFGLGFTPGDRIGWFDVIGQGVLVPLELPPRLAWAMNSTNWLAAYVAPLITVTIGWALTVRLKSHRRVLGMLAFALTVVLILTFTRGGILSLAAGLGSLALMRAAQIPNLARRLSPRMLLGLAAVAGALALATLFVLTLSSAGPRRSGDEVRLDLYRSAIEMTRDYPVLGVGPGAFGRAYRSYRSPELARDRMGAAHNAYLGTAAETGLIGLAVSVWLGILLVRTWRSTWQEAPSSARKLRIEVMIAALIGIGVHSMVDIFTTTPMVLLMALLVGYSITGHRSVLDTPSPGQRWPAAIALVIVLGYGIGFVPIDRAQQHYQRSLDAGVNPPALEETLEAARIDPHLNLYRLHAAYLLGEMAYDNPTADLDTAISAYQDALELEPTWDVGWMNLAALTLRDGHSEQALEYVETARAINPLTPATLHTARLAEELNAKPEEDILTLYEQSIELFRLSTGYLPLSDFWVRTDLRREALNNYIAELPAELQYRVLAMHDPERAESLVNTTPETAAEWWIAGEYALTVEDTPERAVDFFSEAIVRNRNSGDYYVSRARATLRLDPEAAHDDLDLAQLLGIQHEYPQAVRAQLSNDPEEVRELLARALPPRSGDYAFSAVLYGGRIAAFDLLPEMRYPGPGREVMQPWYTLAEQYRQGNRLDEARRVYEAILVYAPDEVEAREQLEALEDEGDGV